MVTGPNDPPTNLRPENSAASSAGVRPSVAQATRAPSKSVTTTARLSMAGWRSPVFSVTLPYVAPVASAAYVTFAQGSSSVS